MEEAALSPKAGRAGDVEAIRRKLEEVKRERAQLEAQRALLSPRTSRVEAASPTQLEIAPSHEMTTVVVSPIMARAKEVVAQARKSGSVVETGKNVDEKSAASKTASKDDVRRVDVKSVDGKTGPSSPRGGAQKMADGKAALSPKSVDGKTGPSSPRGGAQKMADGNALSPRDVADSPRQKASRSSQVLSPSRPRLSDVSSVSAPHKLSSPRDVVSPRSASLSRHSARPELLLPPELRESREVIVNQRKPSLMTMSPLVITGKDVQSPRSPITSPR
jgi:hypothetical protein